MKKLLLAGASYGDIPLIKEAKKLGFYVITSGNREDDLGHKYSDEYHLCDFSDKDALLELAKQLQIQAIVPSCHDLSIVSCAFVAEQLNLGGYDSYETTLNLHHKDRFRKIADEINLMAPKAYSFDNMLDLKQRFDVIPIPCIVKPIDLGGGKGISIIRNVNEFERAIDYALECSKAKKIVIEEFVEGNLQSFSSFIKDQKVVFYFGDNEFSSFNPYGVATSTSPSKFFDSVKYKLIDEVEKIATSLKLSNGLLHMQYLQNNDKVNIVEFTRRMPGDWYSVPVKLSTGVNHAYWVLQGYLAGDFSDIQHSEQVGYYSRHCLMAHANGVIDKIYIDDAIRGNIVDQFIWYSDFGQVEDFVYQKFGLFFLKYSSQEEMEEKTNDINNLLLLRVRT